MGWPLQLGDLWDEDPLPVASRPIDGTAATIVAVPIRRMARVRGRASIPMARIRAMNELIS